SFGKQRTHQKVTGHPEQGIDRVGGGDLARLRVQRVVQVGEGGAGERDGNNDAKGKPYKHGNSWSDSAPNGAPLQVCQRDTDKISGRSPTHLLHPVLSVQARRSTTQPQQG